MFIGGLVEAEIAIIFSRSGKMSWPISPIEIHTEAWQHQKIMQENNEIGPTHFSTCPENDLYLGF